jgi:hypothetical protein
MKFPLAPRSVIISRKQNVDQARRKAMLESKNDISRKIDVSSEMGPKELELYNRTA